MSTDGQPQDPQEASRPDPVDGGVGRSTGMRTWLKVLLAVSLAANLAVAGLAIGAAMRWHDGDHPGRRPPSVGAIIYQELDRETRRELRRRAAGEYDSHAARRLAEAEAVIAALLADPFEAQRLSELLQRQTESRNAFHVSVQHAWVALVDEMSPEDRSRYALRLQEVLRKKADRNETKAERP